jgi:predicted metal-dependent hydrolase
MTPPRLTELPLPPYAFVPGRFPHPHSDPAGHRFGVDLPPAQPIIADRWQDCDRYLLAFDLFNHGYYWEAHEAWEAVWNAVGRHGPVALLLKALIQLAVVGVKLRQGMPDSAAWHAGRAAELVDEVQRETSRPRLLGLKLGTLARHALELRGRLPTPANEEVSAVKVLFAFTLRPSDGAFGAGASA